MKIDYIIGNPPYIRNLYKEIWLKCIKNIAEGGRIQFVTPVGFTRQQGEPDFQLRDYIQRYKTKITLYHNLDIFPVGAAACGGGIAVTDINFSKESKEITVHNHNDNENDYQFQSRVIGDTVPLFKEQLMLMEKFKNLKKTPMNFKNPYQEIKHSIPHRGGSRIQNDETPRRAIGYKMFYRKTEIAKEQEFYVKDHKFFDSSQNPLKNKYTVIQHEMNISNPVIVEPGVVFDELFYIIGVFDTKEEAQKYKDYIQSAPIQCHLATYLATIKASQRPYYSLPTMEEGLKIQYSKSEENEINNLLEDFNKIRNIILPFIKD